MADRGTMLERLLEDTACNLSVPSSKIRQLSSLLLALILDRRHGGFAGFSTLFQRFGMQDMFASWSSAEPSQPIAFNEVKEVFGVPLIAAMGGKLGIGSVMTTRAICYLLPGLIEVLTLEGGTPSAIPDSLRGRCTGTFEWLHEVDAAGWVSWHSRAFMPLQDFDSPQATRIFCHDKLDEMPCLTS